MERRDHVGDGGTTPTMDVERTWNSPADSQSFTFTQGRGERQEEEEEVTSNIRCRFDVNIQRIRATLENARIPGSLVEQAIKEYTEFMKTSIECAQKLLAVVEGPERERYVLEIERWGEFLEELRRMEQTDPDEEADWQQQLRAVIEADLQMEERTGFEEVETDWMRWLMDERDLWSTLRCYGRVVNGVWVPAIRDSIDWTLGYTLADTVGIGRQNDVLPWHRFGGQQGRAGFEEGENDDEDDEDDEENDGRWEWLKREFFRVKKMERRHARAANRHIKRHNTRTRRIDSRSMK